MKYLSVRPEQISELYSKGVPLLNGVVPCSSLEQALLHKDTLYVRPLMTEARYAEYVELKAKIAALTERKDEIEADIQRDGEIAFCGSTEKTGSFDLGGFSLTMTKSDRVQMSENEGSEVFNMMQQNPAWVTSKLVYNITTPMRQAVAILIKREYSNTTYEEAVDLIYTEYEKLREIRRQQGEPVGRVTGKPAFLKSLKGTQTKRAAFLESKGFSIKYATAISESLTGPINLDAVKGVLTALGVRSVNSPKVQELLQHFALNTVTSFSLEK